MESLTGRPNDDLLKNMIDFKVGRKTVILMRLLTSGYSDE
jgi:cytochrome c553